MGVGGKGWNIVHDTGLVTFNDDTGEVIKVAGPHTVLEGGNEWFLPSAELISILSAGSATLSRGVSGLRGLRSVSWVRTRVVVGL
jgi:hypothetical protein